MNHSIRPLFALVLIAALVPASRAAVFTVGSGAGCNHDTIQAAIAAAQNSPGVDVVRISRSAIYAQQELLVDTGQELELVGGYDTCGSATPSGTTTISGAGGNARQVLRVYARDGGVIRLRHLTITGGDNTSDGEGGGIYFEGNGRLEVHDSLISQNTAGYGAGIYARSAQAGSASLVFGQNVVVANNTARRSGGGVYVDQMFFYMREPGSILMWNVAEGAGGGGYGGGLVVLGKAGAAMASIGAGVPGLGAIFANTAAFGGGVAVVTDDPGDIGTVNVSYAEVRVYPGAGQPVAAIRDNIASQRGGGIFLRPYQDFDDTVRAEARLWNAELDGNSAPEGAAIYAASVDSAWDDPMGATVQINSDEADGAAAWPGPLECAQGQFCGSIRDNTARTLDGDPTGGAVIHLEQAGTFDIGQRDEGRPARGGASLEGNVAGRLVLGGDNVALRIGNTLLADNQVSDALIRREGGGTFSLDGVTLTGNAIGSSHAIALGSGELAIRRSMLWQDGHTLLQCGSCNKTFEYVIASERGSLDGGQTPHVQVRPPRFVDPARGDYTLRAASPAVDYAPASGIADLDALTHPRDADLPFVANWNGPRDVGAFERQSLLPLVLNGNFDTDLNLWNEIVPGASWTADQNAAGAPGSGSLAVSIASPPQPRVTVRGQCIHLPGPGRYLLNGWGRSGGNIATRDSVLLRWELRRDGDEGCTAGPPDASGDHHLASSGSWVRPANPARIELAPAEWTHESSLNVQLVVVDNGITFPGSATGWFDGITLEVESGDIIFQDDFER